MKNDHYKNRWHSNLEYIKGFARTPFIELPLYLQMVIVLIVSVFLFWLFNTHLFNHQSREISVNKNTIDALMWKINRQTNFIESAKYDKNDPNFEQFVSCINIFNPANFIKQISSLAKKTRIEIQAIKPVESELEKSKITNISTQSLQIEVVGKYSNIFAFLVAIPRFSTLVTIGNFQITPLLTTKEDGLLHDRYLLALTATINLYGYSL